MSRETSFSMTNWPARSRCGTGEPWSKGFAALCKPASIFPKRRSNSAGPRKRDGKLTARPEQAHPGGIVCQAERRDLAVLSIVFAAGLFVAGPPVRDRRMEMPAPPPRCINGVNGECSAPFWGRPSARPRSAIAPKVMRWALSGLVFATASPIGSSDSKPRRQPRPVFLSARRRRCFAPARRSVAPSTARLCRWCHGRGSARWRGSDRAGRLSAAIAAPSVPVSCGLRSSSAELTASTARRDARQSRRGIVIARRIELIDGVIGVAARPAASSRPPACPPPHGCRRAPASPWCRRWWRPRTWHWRISAMAAGWCSCRHCQAGSALMVSIISRRIIQLRPAMAVGLRGQRHQRVHEVRIFLAPDPGQHAAHGIARSPGADASRPDASVSSRYCAATMSS